MLASDRPGDGNPLVAGDAETDISGVGDYRRTRVGPGDLDAVVSGGIVDDNDMHGDASRLGRVGYRCQTFVQEGRDVVTDYDGDGIGRMIAEVGQVRRHWVGDA